MADSEHTNFAENLIWRQPVSVIALVAWVFAGPLNPAVLAAILLIGMPVYGAVLVLALPSTIGVGLFLLRRSGKPITMDGLVGAIFGWAVATIPIYIGLFFLFVFGAGGLEESIVQMIIKGGTGALLGLLVSTVYGWFALIYAVPATFGAIIAIRVIALRRDQNGEPIAKTATHYTP